MVKIVGISPEEWGVMLAKCSGRSGKKINEIKELKLAFRAFNPLVDGSNPSRPTKIRLKSISCSKKSILIFIKISIVALLWALGFLTLPADFVKILQTYFCFSIFL